MWCIALSLTVVAWADPPRIEVRERTSVQAAHFTLGEIATFSGVDTQTRERLGAVVLGASPLPGLERLVTREQIITRLRQHGFRPEEFNLVTPSRIVIHREATLLQAQQVVKAAIARLREVLRLPEEAQVECDVPPRDLPLPKGEAQIGAGEPRSLGGGLYTVPVQVTSSEGAPVTLNVRLRVAYLREVLVAQRAIRAGEMIDDSALTVQRTTTRDSSGDWLTDPAEAVGKIARQTIPAGSPLKRSAIDEPALIRRGQPVKLLVPLGGAVIEAGAVAQQDGKGGARIRVQVTDTRKTLLATVIDAQTVRLDVP
ncbi:MAG: flagellar basal body P-ring formation chaperone FlgA [Armatimonadota bacterium]|nr:flagellar basal body P-ring formation chaperone FlgA [Armatimonadota bacterium]